MSRNIMLNKVDESVLQVEGQIDQRDKIVSQAKGGINSLGKEPLPGQDCGCTNSDEAEKDYVLETMASCEPTTVSRHVHGKGQLAGISDYRHEVEAATTIYTTDRPPPELSNLSCSVSFRDEKC
ncbi:hypothetical protein Bpfe_006185 [Biomphalaria pfeifferi]|uniref:Uncharacterized protein n=1 Tax=Biomphalaria pfeifferi TaxID=112525 RepID=A0AAD8C108_BIOPF|nr:hypothetical protein Bpfe_006185 [Biomphalaria pfeifferi]